MWRFFLLIPLWFSCGCDENISTDPTPPSNADLVQRGRLYYKPNDHLPFSGSFQQKHKTGNKSFESVYTNGLKLLQRSWRTNGILSEEYRFHESHIVARRDWDHTGKLQKWKELEDLAEEQFVRAAKFANNQPPDIRRAYLWFHIAATNGHLASQRLLEYPPEGLTLKQLGEIEAEANLLLGLDTIKSGNLPDQNASIKK